MAGHIPEAINIPLFNDEERASVGICYKNQGRCPAIAEGLRIVGQKAQDLLRALGRFSDGERIYVHCWRGGMRSEAFNWLACQSGLSAERISGGYKAYRRAAHECFAQPMKIVILSGYTGVGKTVLLQELRSQGEQVIDLEFLASHRGSAFGGIGQPEQPTVEQFENDLFEALRGVDPERPIWIEDESQSIGRVNIRWHCGNRCGLLREFLLARIGTAELNYWYVSMVGYQPALWGMPLGESKRGSADSVFNRPWMLWKMIASTSLQTSH